MSEYNFSLWEYLKGRYYTWKVGWNLKKAWKLLEQEQKIRAEVNRLTLESEELLAKSRELLEKMKW